MSKIKGLLIFAAGAVAGTVAGIGISKRHFEAIAAQEINEVRDYYIKVNKELADQLVDKTSDIKEEQVEEHEKIEESAEKSIEEETKKEYDNIIKYGNYVTTEEIDDEEDDYSDDEPYIIDPSEFGNNGNYATQTCTYFADGVLVDDVDEVIEDPEKLVGNLHVDIFRDFDATSVYVRNDWMKMDFEILKDDWFWSDFDNVPSNLEAYKKPHQL